MAEPAETSPAIAYELQQPAVTCQHEHAEGVDGRLFSVKSIHNVLRWRTQLLLMTLQEYAQALLDLVSPGILPNICLEEGKPSHSCYALYTLF